MEKDDSSILEKLDSVVPSKLSSFDAFPKLPSTYKQRSESRGFLTLFVGFIVFVLLLNDISEFIWGWPDHEFGVDRDKDSYMIVNVDMVVNMPCQYLSVDLRDAVGDRLFLSKGFHRDGTLFDIGQATSLKEHSEAISANQAVSQSRKSRGFFSFFTRSTPTFRPTYNYQKDGSACRVYGSLAIKRVTANLHITTLGHGYASQTHVDHKLMNLSHIITEFSFGPFFPDITQPLDYSYEVTQDPFVAYQYFLHVVPTTYIAPRSEPLRTNQYSVTHYTRVLEHARGTPGIFFKFDIDSMRLSYHQRTTTFIKFAIRAVGVIGGVFVCMGYAIRITTRAVKVVVGSDSSEEMIAAEASGVRPGGLRSKWGGSSMSLHSRKGSTTTGRVVRQGNGWVVEGQQGVSSPYTQGSGYISHTPTSSWGGSPNPAAAGPYSPYISSPGLAPPGSNPSSIPGTPNPALGLGFGPYTPNGTGGAGFPTAGTIESPYVPPSPYLHSPSPPISSPGPPQRTPSNWSANENGNGHFPPSPNPGVNGAGGYAPPPPPPMKKKDD